MKRFSAVMLMCLGLAPAAGCGSSSSTPTSPTTGSSSFTLVFSSTLTPGDTPSFPISLPGTAPVHLTFGSLVDATGFPLGSTVTLTYGIRTADGLGCQPLTRVSTPAALKAQINVLASTGTYCVGLEDTGNVPSGASFAIRVVYGTPSAATDAETISYSSSVLPGGTTSRTFESAAGVATVTLESFSPASVTTLGLAVGFQASDATGCKVNAALVASRGSGISVPVDAGTYCVKVFDPGTLTDVATFTVKIVHP